MALIFILDRPIHVYLPMDKTRKCLAFISGTPMTFWADTPLKAKKAADDWRKEEFARMAEKDPKLRKVLEEREAAQ